MDDRKEFLKMLVEGGYSVPEIAAKLTSVGIRYKLVDGEFTIVEEECCERERVVELPSEEQGLTILGCMSDVMENLTVSSQEGRKFNQRIYDECSREFAYICRMVGIRKEEALLLSVIADNEGRHGFDKHDLAERMGLSYIRLLSFGSSFTALADKRLIYVNKNGNVSICKRVISALADNKPYEIRKMSGLGTREFLKELRGIVRARFDDEIDENKMMEELSELVEGNRECPLVAEAVNLGVEGEDRMGYVDRMIFWVLVYRYIYEDDDQVRWDDFVSIVEDEFDLAHFRHMYERKNLKLQKMEIIEPCIENGMASPEYFHITDEVKEKLFAEVGGVRKSAGEVLKVIRPEDIQERELYYNKEEGEQVRRLEGLLQPENFRNTCERLKSSGLRTGFSCLFYGGPGTGKTESVYQMAKRTGRPIIPINVNEIKSCWVGESEKMIAGVFSKYRQIVKNSDVAPILLFNEADAIFGIRMQGAEHAVDKMENAIQNILLEGMEKLNDGILIATTNLTRNLDPAFERRFLYKIKFGKPGLKAKTRIWKYMIPDLSESQARELAEDFDFSGGQIENISRKKIIKAIIDGVEPDFDEVKSYCGQEHIQENGDDGHRIGY